MSSKVLRNPDHVLHHLLPSVSTVSHSYSLRPRVHDKILTDRLSHWTDCHFIIRLLFYQAYWYWVFVIIRMFISFCTTAFRQFVIKRICCVMLWPGLCNHPIFVWLLTPQNVHIHLRSRYRQPDRLRGSSIGVRTTLVSYGTGGVRHFDVTEAKIILSS